MAYYVWLFLAQICLFYYLLCALYAGINSSFIFIWLLGAGFFGVVFAVRVCTIVGLIDIPVGFTKAFRIVFIFAVLIFAILESLIVVNMVRKPKDDCKYMIVLGCQIRGSNITRSLKNRLDTAYTYASEHPDVQIIVSGGQGKGEDTSEAAAMKQYLLEKGIEESRIQMEDQSFNTNQNMEYSQKLIENTDDSVAIVTSNFHVFRAKMLANAKGLSNVSTISSPSDHVLFLNYMVREAIGIVKDFVVGNFSS